MSAKLWRVLFPKSWTRKYKKVIIIWSASYLYYLRFTWFKLLKSFNNNSYFNRNNNLVYTNLYGLTARTSSIKAIIPRMLLNKYGLWTHRLKTKKKTSLDGSWFGSSRIKRFHCLGPRDYRQRDCCQQTPEQTKRFARHGFFGTLRFIHCDKLKWKQF